jgi:hypothetical protein
LYLAPTMVGTRDAFPLCRCLDLLCLATTVSLEGDVGEGGGYAATTYELWLTGEDTEPSDRYHPILSHCVGWYGLKPPFWEVRDPRH